MRGSALLSSRLAIFDQSAQHLIETLEKAAAARERGSRYQREQGRADCEAGASDGKEAVNAALATAIVIPHAPLLATTKCDSRPTQCGGLIVVLGFFDGSKTTSAAMPPH